MPDMTPEEIFAENQQLFSDARERIEIAFMMGKRQGITNPVVFLLDLADSTAWGLLPNDPIRAQGEEMLSRALDRNWKTAIATTVCPVSQAKTVLANAASEVVRKLDEDPPAGFYYVVVVANGVTSLALHPMEPD